MGSLTLLSPAKINLTLEILGRRQDGYHEIRSIVQPIDLFDEVRIEQAEEDIELTSSGIEIPQGRDNLAWRAAELYLSESGIDVGVRIDIKKKIPTGSGLGGGSSNAAAVLSGLNRIFGVLPEDDLLRISSSLGADVPLFIRPVSAVIEGIGEKIAPLRDLPLFYYVILCPNVNVSTESVYRKWDEMNEVPPQEKREHGEVENAVEQLRNISGGFPLRNDLEAPAEALYPEIKAFKQILTSLEAPDVQMTGSGGAVFAVFRDEDKAEAIYSYLKTSPTFRVYMATGIKGRHRLI